MIAEAAYYLAAERGFLGEHALDDWLIAEQQVRQLISPKKTEFGLRSKQKRVKKRSGPVFRSASSVKP